MDGALSLGASDYERKPLAAPDGSADGMNLATDPASAAVAPHNGRGSMPKERRVRRMFWAVLIVAAVTGLMLAAPPTRTEPAGWTGWTAA